MSSFVLGPNARSAGYRLWSFDAVGSTNAEALAMARRGDPGRVWVAALQQTAGVGRRGRPWQTAHGNLAASVLTVFAGPTNRAATLGFVAGLALERALTAIAPALAVDLALDAGTNAGRTHFALKWPNDVVAGGAKIAGILLQAEPLDGGRLAVVVGIGVNVVAPPEGVDQPTTALTALGCRTTAEELFVELAEAFVELEEVWAGGRGLDRIRRLWLARASGVGEPVAVRAEAGIVRGVFETIDEEGRLVVLTGAGERIAITAGEVHFGVAGSLKPIDSPAA